MNNKQKKSLYYFTKLSQVLGSRFVGFRKNKKVCKVVLYPEFQSKGDLVDHVNRIRWYIPGNTSAEVRIAVSRCLDGIDLNNLPVPACQRMPTDNGRNTRIYICDKKEFRLELESADVICVWNTKVSGWLRKLLPYLLRVRIVDPDFYHLTETHTYPAILWYDIYNKKERAVDKKQSMLLFLELYKKLSGNRRAYIFGTGPSIKEADNHFFEDGVRIVCNSMVKNDRLLELIKPNVIAFTDSVFHFGVSKYSEIFVKDLLKVVRKYKAFCITNQVGYALMQAHYPELASRMIAVPALRFGKDVILTPEKFRTRDHTNILTRYMLPLAAGLSDEMILMGFDGRNPDENYFWKHNPTTQYSDSMESAYKTHPAFFRDTSYEGYYEKHCLILQKMFEEFEHQGKKIVAWGNSYIPALQKRLSKKQ